MEFLKVNEFADVFNPYFKLAKQIENASNRNDKYAIKQLMEQLKEKINNNAMRVFEDSIKVYENNRVSVDYMFDNKLDEQLENEYCEYIKSYVSCNVNENIYKQKQVSPELQNYINIKNTQRKIEDYISEITSDIPLDWVGDKAFEYYIQQQHKILLSLYQKSNQYNTSVSQLGSEIIISFCERTTNYLSLGCKVSNNNSDYASDCNDPDLIDFYENANLDNYENFKVDNDRQAFEKQKKLIEKLGEEKYQKILERNRAFCLLSVKAKRQKEFQEKVRFNINLANVDYVKFLTLTISPKKAKELYPNLDIFDPKQVNKIFTKFMKNANAILFSKKQKKSKNSKKNKKDNVLNKLKYSAVCEPHSSGQVHYHVIVYNARFLDYKLLREVWAIGNIHDETLKALDSDKLSKYVSKTLANYLSKNLTELKPEVDKIKWYNVRTVFHSNNLKDVIQSRLYHEDREFIDMLKNKARTEPDEECYVYRQFDYARLLTEKIDVVESKKKLKEYNNYKKRNKLDKLEPNIKLFIEEYSDEAFHLSMNTDDYIKLCKQFDARAFAPATGAKTNQKDRQHANNNILTQLKLI